MSFCSKCGTSNVEDALFCTECGQAIKAESLGRIENNVSTGMESNPPSKKKVIGIIVCVLVWLFLVANVFGASSNKRAVYAMKAEQLGKEYLDNANLADNRYKGARIYLNGIVARKGQYIDTNDLFVEVYNFESHIENGKRKTVKILITIPIQEKSKVNNLKIGDVVEVDGKCVGQVPQEDKMIISVQLVEANISN